MNTSEGTPGGGSLQPWLEEADDLSVNAPGDRAERHELRVRVTRAGESAAGVVVNAFAPDGSIVATGTTDAEGAAVLPVPSEGEYSVKVFGAETGDFEARGAESGAIPLPGRSDRTAIATPSAVGFTLKLRIVSPLMEPYSSPAYRLHWGNTPKSGHLGPHGDLEHDRLDANAEEGILQLGDEDDNGVFQMRMMIPLKRHRPAAEQSQPSPEPTPYEKRLYDVAFRLCNLGMLGCANRVPFDDSYPVPADQAMSVKEGLRRYKFKHGFRILDPEMDRATDTFYDGDPEIRDQLLQHILKLHDG